MERREEGEKGHEGKGETGEESIERLERRDMMRERIKPPSPHRPTQSPSDQPPITHLPLKVG